MRIDGMVLGVGLEVVGVACAYLVIGWPALLVGAPLVFASLVVVAVLWVTSTPRPQPRLPHADDDADPDWWPDEPYDDRLRDPA